MSISHKGKPKYCNGCCERGGVTAHMPPLGTQHEWAHPSECYCCFKNQSMQVNAKCGTRASKIIGACLMLARQGRM
eukprot:6467063-Amphidinium_carterae.2